MNESYDLVGFPVSITNPDAFREVVERELIGGCGAIFVGVYASLVTRLRTDRQYREIVQQCHLYADGKGMEWGLRFLHPRAEARRTATTDFWLDILESARRHSRDIFVIGGVDHVNEAACALISELGYAIAGAGDGYGDHLLPGSALRTQIAHADAPVVLLGLGAGKQEVIAAELVRGAIGNPPCVFTVGGLFDHITGQTRRAPAAVQDAGLEWAWRVAQEPRRLMRRYLVGNALFVGAVLKQWMSQREFAPMPAAVPSGSAAGYGVEMPAIGGVPRAVGAVREAAAMAIGDGSVHFVASGADRIALVPAQRQANQVEVTDVVADLRVDVAS